MNITPKGNPRDFNKFLLEKVQNNSYQYKFLNDYIQQAINGSKPLYDASLLNISGNGWILIIHGEVLLIYGEKWNKKQFQEIKDSFDLTKFNNYTVLGESHLIHELIDFFEIKNYEIDKERIYYKANKINDFNPGELKIENGQMIDSDELAEMLQQYYHEEYNGLNDKSIEEMKERMFSLILSQTIFVLKKSNNVILSFCTVIDPDIGILFTKKDCRGNGYGKIILSHCSQLLKQINNEIYLMTDKSKIESNKVIETVGFKPYFNYSMVVINRS